MEVPSDITKTLRKKNGEKYSPTTTYLRVLPMGEKNIGLAKPYIFQLKAQKCVEIIVAVVLSSYMN